MARKFAIVVLGLMTLALGVVAVIIGINLAQSPANDIPSEIVDNNCCGTQDYRTCTTDEEWQQGYNDCAQGKCAACSGGGRGCDNDGACEPGEDHINCSSDCDENGDDIGNPDASDGSPVDGGDGDSGGGDGGDGGGDGGGGGPSCPNDDRTAVWCAVFDCPFGDTNGDGQCLTSDQGAIQNNYPAGSCPSQPPSGCGQIDYYAEGPIGSNYGSYCGYSFLNFENCGGGGDGGDGGDGGSSSSSSSSSSTSVQQRECGDSCSTDSQCPNNHVCDGGQCKLIFCVNNPDGCEPDMCTITSEVTIVKNSSPTCHEDGSVTISYTVNVENLGGTQQTIDSVVDTLDSSITANQISNISNGGVKSGNQITWTGPFNIPAGGSIQFTYSVDLTASQASQYSSSGLENIVVVDYGSDTKQFTHITDVACLPNTGLFDEDSRPLLIGLILILLGLLVNRTSGIFNLLSFANLAKVLDSNSNTVKNPIDTKIEEARQSKPSKYEKEVIRSAVP